MGLDEVMNTLSRLFSPKILAVIGGGEWCRAVVQQVHKFGYKGKLYIINKTNTEIAGIQTYNSVQNLPETPDAVFIGINRDATVTAVKELGKMKAGGAVCFASGFKEAVKEDKNAFSANESLLRNSENFHILGPNCYGFINALDNIALWPDQHGCKPVKQGVAILTQSSNIAINITMQNRGLPIAYVVTCGNQLQIDQAEIASFLLDDSRITAIGFHIEGFKDIRKWEALSRKAKSRGIPLIAIKTGSTDQAKNATESHTASIAGDHTASKAFLERLNIKLLTELPTFLETLKLLHCHGELNSNKVGSVSCSGGEAALIADLGIEKGLLFPKLNKRQKKHLRVALGPKVALANPLDYHTYIWRDKNAMVNAWGAIIDPKLALTFFILDYPRADRCDLADWEIATDVVIDVKEKTSSKIAVVSTLPELMPEYIADRLMMNGIVPFNGLSEALTATQVGIKKSKRRQKPLLISVSRGASKLVPEFEAKERLNQLGINVPNGIICESLSDIPVATKDLTFPLVVKSVDVAHKTEKNGVHLNCLSNRDVTIAAKKVTNSGSFLIEEMVPKGFELLVGIVKNNDQGFILTIGVGGIFSELSDDHFSVLVPSSKSDFMMVLKQLKIFKILTGYRGLEGADLASIVETIWKLQTYVIKNFNNLIEIEVNPLICTKHGAFVADALITEIA